MFYKKSSADLVKRYASILGPGIRPLVDPTIGTSKTFRMMVLDDTSIPIENTRERLHNLLFGDNVPSEEDAQEFERLMSFFGDSYDMSDAQGFMTPHRFNQLERGLGRAWGTGNVMKPLYFDLHRVETTKEDGTKYSTASPRLIKYSSIVLEDSLVLKFRLLRNLRSRMEALKVDELTFKSAVKEGAPITNTLDFNSFIKMNGGELMDIHNWETKP